MSICCETPWELRQGLCNNLEGGMGRKIGGTFRREGTYVYLWLGRLRFGRKRQNSVRNYLSIKN